MDFVMLALIGSAAGLLAGVTGLAGGVVVVPALIWIYGPEVLHAAIVASWFCVFSNSLSAATRQWLQRTPAQRLALWHSTRWYLVGAALVSGSAALVAVEYRGIVSAPLVGALQLALVAAILLPSPAADGRRWQQPAGDLGLGALVGGLSTLTGTGGGCYTIAYLICAAGLHLRDAVAAATLTGTVVGGLGVLGYLVSITLWPHTASHALAGPLDGWGLAVLVMAGAIAAPFGVGAARRLSTPLLRQLMAAALGVSALRLLLT